MQKNTSYSFLLNSIIVILTTLFSISLFKNISYPLLWNDEAEGAMTGRRCLEYGYPKVHDGKNIVFLSLAADLKDSDGNLVGYNKRLDANTYVTWGNYYVSALGVFLSDFTDDIYTKTAISRLTFAIFGFFGMIVFCLAFRDLLPCNWLRLFIASFAFIELFSISLVLHMREARYFSLVIFLSACFFYIYIRYFLAEKLRPTKYYALMTLLLVVTYHMNFITFAIFSAVLLFNRGSIFVVNALHSPGEWTTQLWSTFKESIPVLISMILNWPFIVWFETFKTAKAISEYTQFTLYTYVANLVAILRYLTQLEFFYVCMVMAAGAITVWCVRKTRVSADAPSSERVSLTTLWRCSFVLASFGILYSLIIARTPYLFVRHYIVLQPVTVLLMVLSLFIVLFSLEGVVPKKSEVMWKTGVIVVAAVLFMGSAKDKVPYMMEHVHEITHRYRGPLDYVIPYIQENYGDPGALTIATNYEEVSYMYYLNSKVIIGYIANNLEEDAKLTPDIIMFRKGWGTNPKVFNDFLQRAKYERVAFDVEDYPVNNIPELEFVFKHRFRTKLAATEEEKADMFVRVKE